MLITATCDRELTANNRISTHSDKRGGGCKAMGPGGTVNEKVRVGQTIVSEAPLKTEK